MSQLTSPPTDLITPAIDADISPAATPGAEVTGPGQIYFSVPVAGPTGSGADSSPAATPGAEVSGPGQIYFSVPVAGPTRSAAVADFERQTGVVSLHTATLASRRVARPAA